MSLTISQSELQNIQNVVTSATLASATTQTPTVDVLLSSGTYVQYSDINWTFGAYNKTKYPTNSDMPPSAFDTIIDYEAIKGSIHNIIYTEMGERVMEPTFGIPKKALLFDFGGAVMTSKLRYIMNLAFSNWDPRLSVKNIYVSTENNNEVEAYIEIAVAGLKKPISIVYVNDRSTW